MIASSRLLGAAQVVEEPRVVQGLGGPGGEVAAELQLVVAERLTARAADERQRAKRRPAADQRQDEHRLVAEADDVLGAVGVVADLLGEVLQQHRLARPQCRGDRVTARELERMLLAQAAQVVGDGRIDGGGDRAAQRAVALQEVEDRDVAERRHEEVGEALDHHARLEHRVEQVAHGGDEVGAAARGPLGVALGHERASRLRERPLGTEQGEGDGDQQRDRDDRQCRAAGDQVGDHDGQEADERDRQRSRAGVGDVPGR